MNKLTKPTVMTILHDAASDSDCNIRELYNKLIQKGMKITHASFYLYYKGDVVPPYEVLSEMSRALNLGYKDNELKEIHDATKETVRANQPDKLYHLNLKLKLETINPIYRVKNEAFKLDIEQRAREVFEDKELAKRFKAKGNRQLSAYFAYLIAKDLEENENDYK